MLRLSDLLRHSLYEGQRPLVPINDEINLLKSYIELERIRQGNNARIEFNKSGTIDNQMIEPLLLLPLVENAFKHGISETRGQAFVDIHLSIKQRQLIFLVKNSDEQFPGEADVKENIGLSNLRRQLELLYHDYNLAVQRGPAVFSASLKINLASHV